MRGTVAKRLRRQAFERHQFDKKPSLLQQILRKIITFKDAHGKDWKFGIRQNVYAPGYKRTYKDLKRAYGA